MASWERQTTSGEPLVMAGGRVTVTPQAQRLVLRWRSVGFVWNRPVAMLVERNGRLERYPIRDVTRLAQLGLAGATLLAVVAILIGSWSRKGAAQPWKRPI